MRVAIISDIHGNLTAFEAILSDLRQTSPDLILHGGDLADGGSNPREIIDTIADLGWKGVCGNTDEMLFAPGSLAGFSSASPPQFRPLFAAVQEMAAWTRDALGVKRIDWLRGLPVLQEHEGFSLVHASPHSAWRAPGADAPGSELEQTFADLRSPLVVYGHIHRPYIRSLTGFEVANSGSVGLSQDGDNRASYLLVDGGKPQIRRIEYDLQRELAILSESRLPHASWVARMLRLARFEMP